MREEKKGKVARSLSLGEGWEEEKAKEERKPRRGDDHAGREEGQRREKAQKGR